MFIYLDTATPRLMLSLLLIIVSRQGPILMANVGCCVVTLVIRQKLWDIEKHVMRPKPRYRVKAIELSLTHVRAKI